MNPVLEAVLLLFAGVFCGFLNTLASSGSAVSLPAMIFLGMDPGSANATNRLPVLAGAIAALFTFQRGEGLDWRLAARLTPPVLAGTIAGALSAELLPSRQMGLMITAAVLIALLLLFTKIKSLLAERARVDIVINAQVWLALFGAGFWCGFIVLDCATYFLLILVLLVRMDMLQANIYKTLFVGIGAFAALAVFYEGHLVDWKAGGILSAGSIAGGFIGARMAQMANAKIWVFRLLVTVILLEVVHLGIKYLYGIV
jgi:uncharacterized membrane protein YfcA